MDKTGAEATIPESWEPIEFPREIGGYGLRAESGGANAFYEKDVGFGFKHAIKIVTVWPEDKPEKPLIRVRHLSGNSGLSGKTTRWLVVRSEYFLTPRQALDNLLGVKVKPRPPKRKPILQPPLTDGELRAYLGLEAA